MQYTNENMYVNEILSDTVNNKTNTVRSVELILFPNLPQVL